MQAWTSSAGNAAALSLLRAGSLLSRVGSDAAYIDEPEERAIPPLLESRYVEEKVEGLKRTIALINLGKDVSEYFPQVVKNVATPSLEVKKLVYMYLVHYAEKKPDEALLAINTLQKDLSNPDPTVRALALRALTGIRVRVAAPLAVLAVQKCSRDASAYVRRCAAHAVLKLHSLDPVQYGPPMEAVLTTLLGDASPSVVGSAAAALRSVAPDTLGAFARHFPRLCQMLPDLEEWGQIVVLDALLRCARVMFPHPPESGEAGQERVGSSLGSVVRDGLRSGLGDGREGRDGEGGSKTGVNEVRNDGAPEGETHRQGGVEGRSMDGPGTSRGRTTTRGEKLDGNFANREPLDRRRSSAVSAPSESASVESFYFEGGGEPRGVGYAGVPDPLPAIVRPDSLHEATAPELSFQGGAGANDSVPPELRLLLYCSSPLLTSRNSGVVLGAAVLHWHLALPEELPRVVKPLTFLLRSSPRETQYLALSAIATMARERPSLFRGEVRRFFVRAGDPLFVRKLKLEVLTTVAGEGSVNSVLKELQVYVTDADAAFVASVVRALGKLARQVPTVAVRCVRGLLSLALSGEQKATGTDRPSGSGRSESAEGQGETERNGEASSAGRSEPGGAVPSVPSKGSGTDASQRTEAPLGNAPHSMLQNASRAGIVSAASAPLGGSVSQTRTALGSPPGNELVVSESVSVLCGLIRTRPEEFDFAAVELVTGLERIEVSEARAAVLALLADLCGREGVWERVTPVVLRFVVGRFAAEEDVVKLAVLELASKYWLSLSEGQRPHERLLLHHAFTLAKYDSSVDIRDRARFLRRLLNAHDLAFPTERTPSESQPPPTASSEIEKQPLELGAGLGSDGKENDQDFRGQVSGRVNDDQDRLADQEVVRNLLLRPKPASRPPEIAPDRSAFLVGTMSHEANHTAPGYQALPEIGAPREAYGIGTDGKDGSEMVGETRQVSDELRSESSEYSGSYESSDGDSGSGSGASESEGYPTSEAGHGSKEEGVEPSVRASFLERSLDSGQSSDPNVVRQGRTANGAYDGGTEQKLLPKDAASSNEGQEALTGGKPSKSAGNFVGDLLSANDLESWLGSLRVSDFQK
ncbi:adapitin protein complex [Klebsormidium nitens]|uniref:AP-3 complex subunit beta n=1 Tax=Klebsormidium nitens TaxID=105231 RepID=A0A1Y1I9N8_KLENI|nr:adapitin protein complex [Klebsormidium nitens]|eukprot:GAQ85841.1 adapitin protein complex [Klebsormidium nitens]